MKTQRHNRSPAIRPLICPIIRPAIDRPVRRPVRSPVWLGAWSLICLVAGSGCLAKKRTVGASVTAAPLPVAVGTEVGACANPTSEGLFSANPDIERADRDLDGDRVDEMVVMDRTLCTAQKNCHWNIYRTENGCHRYVGTVSAFAIQRLRTRGEGGFFGLRGIWNLTGGQRVLMQEYQFQRGGYRLKEALLCRYDDGDRLLCEERGR